MTYFRLKTLIVISVDFGGRIIRDPTTENEKRHEHPPMTITRTLHHGCPLRVVTCKVGSQLLLRFEMLYFYNSMSLLGTICYVSLLLLNAIAILNEERFLARSE